MASAMRDKAALEEAILLLGRLRKNVYSWNEPGNPQEEFHASVALIDSILGDATGETPKKRRQAVARVNKFLGPVLAPIVREVALPALRRGRPPIRARPGQPAGSPRDRWIAATGEQICRNYGFDLTRNPSTTRHCAASIIAKALDRLGMPLSEKRVARILTKYGRH
jgi:hypothetical protein